MAKKLNIASDVIDAFAAAYPGGGSFECLEWVTAWRACYPQFEDLIFEKATEIVLANADAFKGGYAMPAAAAPKPMVPQEKDTVRLQFIALDDPTPEDLADWMKNHPAMGDELTELATTMSTMAYLQLTPLPATRAEKAADRHMVDAMVERIAKGRIAPRKRTSATDVRSVPTPNGAALREMRAAAAANHALEAKARRSKGAEGAR